MLRRVAVPCLALAALASPSRAETLKVPQQFPTIQEAVDSAAAGDTVLVAKGTYHENVTVGTSDITLKGKGATIDGAYEGNCLVLEGNGITIDGFVLANGGSTSLLDGATPGGLSAEGGDIVLRRCTVRHAAGYGIRLIGTGTIDQCVVESCLDDGLIINTGNGVASELTTVRKTVVVRCGGDGFNGLFGPFDLQKNVFDGNQGDGARFVVGILVPDVGSTFSKNRFTGNSGIGLEVDLADGVPGADIEDNVSERNAVGLRLSGVFSVTGNTVQNNLFDGVQLFTPGLAFEDNKVLDNGIVGVFVNDGLQANQLFIAGNTISGNAGDGLRVNSGLVQVFKNTLRDNAGDGLQIDGSAPNGEVLANKVLGNGHDGIDNRATGTLISDNICKGNGGADIGAIGIGAGTTDGDSSGNVTGDGSALDSVQELELETIE